MLRVNSTSSLDLEHFYRPQRSCAKVIFLHVCVILSTGGGGRGWGACVVMGACVAGGRVW